MEEALSFEIAGWCSRGKVEESWAGRADKKSAMTQQRIRQDGDVLRTKRSRSKTCPLAGGRLFWAKKDISAL
jgi:hypothetical protein